MRNSINNITQFYNNNFSLSTKRVHVFLINFDLFNSDDFKEKLETVKNPYEGVNTAKKIINVLQHHNGFEYLKKEFYDIESLWVDAPQIKWQLARKRKTTAAKKA